MVTVPKSRNSDQTLEGSRGTSRGLVDTSFAFVTDIIVVCTCLITKPSLDIVFLFICYKHRLSNPILLFEKSGHQQAPQSQESSILIRPPPLPGIIPCQSAETKFS